MKTYAYARISKDHDRSVAVEDQMRKIRAFAEATDRTIDTEFVDRDASGRSLKRPAMQELLSILKPGDTVIIHRLDRLTRSVRDLGDLLERGFHIVSVSESLDTNSASGRLIVNILGVVSQWEREVIAERTTNSLAYKRSAGKAYGPVPYGYVRDDEGNLVAHESEQAILDLMRSLRRQGKSNEAIAETLNLSCYPARGKKWYRASVGSILGSKMEADALAS